MAAVCRRNTALSPLTDTSSRHRRAFPSSLSSSPPVLCTLCRVSVSPVCVYEGRANIAVFYFRIYRLLCCVFISHCCFFLCVCLSAMDDSLYDEVRAPPLPLSLSVCIHHLIFTHHVCSLCVCVCVCSLGISSARWTAATRLRLI